MSKCISLGAELEHFPSTKLLVISVLDAKLSVVLKKPKTIISRFLPMLNQNHFVKQQHTICKLIQGN